jgi:hypothetical protein
MSVQPIGPYEDLPWDPPWHEPGDPGGTFDPPPPPEYALPGLGGFVRPRYTCNLAVTEQMQLLDLFNDVLLPSFRGYITQGPDGKIRLHNKKPVDAGFGTEAFAIGETELVLDDVSAWIGDLSGLVVIDPHTTRSECREVTAAEYDAAAQNAVTLTTNEAGDIDITGFAGATVSVPATATIEILTVVAATEYTVTLDGVEIAFTGSSADSPLTVSSFLTGTFKGHPKLNRRFSFVWDGVNTVTITARFGTLEVDALELAHAAPVADPTVAPVLAADTGVLDAGTYRVIYTYKDEDGSETLPSPSASITIAHDNAIDVSAVTPPAGCTVCWYVSNAHDSDKIRFILENTGSAHTINSLPDLHDALPPDQNRTGCEVMRVAASFSDREETRAGTARSNVLKATFEWSLADQKKRYNRLDYKYRESAQDWRSVELRIHDRPHQLKIKKTESEERNGNAVDTLFQAERIARGEMAENRDSNFRYKWGSTREALLLEEFDVVAITDSGSGVYNLPVAIEKIDLSVNDAGIPKATFVGHLFANTLYDDSIVEREIPVVAEFSEVFTADAYAVLTDTIADNVTFGKFSTTWTYATVEDAIEDTVTIHPVNTFVT